MPPLLDSAERQRRPAIRPPSKLATLTLLIVALSFLLATAGRPVLVRAQTSPLHVLAINTGFEHRSGQSDAIFCITIVDADNVAVGAVTVSGRISSSPVSGTTDAAGVVELRRTVFAFGTYTFTLDAGGVSLTGAEYDPTANVASSASVILAASGPRESACEPGPGAEPPLPEWGTLTLDFSVTDVQTQEAIPETIRTENQLIERLLWERTLTDSLNVTNAPLTLFELLEEDFLQSGTTTGPQGRVLFPSLPKDWLRGGLLAPLADQEVLGRVDTSWTSRIHTRSTLFFDNGTSSVDEQDDSDSCTGSPADDQPLNVQALWYEREGETGRQFVLLNLSAGSANGTDEAGRVTFLAKTSCSLMAEDPLLPGSGLGFALGTSSPWDEAQEYIFDVEFADSVNMACPCTVSGTRGKAVDPWVEENAFATMDPWVLRTVRTETPAFQLQISLETKRPPTVRSVDTNIDGIVLTVPGVPTLDAQGNALLNLRADVDWQNDEPGLVQFTAGAAGSRRYRPRRTDAPSSPCPTRTAPRGI